MRRSAGDLRRIAAIAALVVAAAGIAISLLGTGGGYEIRAQFLDAGQLVKGNVVQVAGQRIGTVKRLDVTDDGRAELSLSIDSDRYRPLHRGTRMTIRTVGLSGVANRYVEVFPGSTRAPEIPDGGVLGTEATTGIVDLDMLLNAFGPDSRDDLRTILVSGAEGVRGSAEATNRFLQYLTPAVGQTRALLEDVTADDAAVGKLVDASAQVAAALASRDNDIGPGIASAATTFDALARERDALGSTLRRAPGVLRQARTTLRGVRETLGDVRPALREARPAARPLASVLRRFVPVSRAARPVLADLETLLPPLRKTLTMAPALARVGVPALRSTTSAVRASAPVFSGLRSYALDALRGVVLGVGAVGGYYDANGHYIRIIGNLDQTQSGKAGIFSLLPDVPLPSLTGRYTGATARCPGSVGGPLRDGSDRIPVDPGFCDPQDGR